MKTSVNVMGIQAKGMLERIGITLKAVMRAGKENKTVIVIGGHTLESGKLGIGGTGDPQKVESEPRLFTAHDPVFYEERLLAEIPEPNWSDRLLVHPKVLAEQGGMGNSIPIQAGTGRARTMRPIRKRTGDIQKKQLSFGTSHQVENVQAREPRDLRSSLSPPLGTR